MSEAPRAARYRLADRLRAGPALLAALVVALGALSVATATAYRRSVVTTTRLTDEARAAQALGRLSREQYIAQTHVILSPDAADPAAEGAPWPARFERASAPLAAALDAPDRALVAEMVTSSRFLSAILTGEVAPAARRRDDRAVHDGHHAAQVVVERMTSQADTLARRLDARARDAEQSALRAATWLTASAILAGVVAVGSAAQVARRLRDATLDPLTALRRVSDRVAEGDHAARVGPLEAAELHDVGRAFDRMLDALADAEARAVGAEKLAAVGRVAAGVAHEINNPLAVIRGYVKTMQEDAPASLTSELAIVDDEAAICQRIVDDLLAYARAPALRRERVSVRSLVTDAVTRLETVNAGPSFRVDVDDAELDADPVRLRQVLGNLLRNAEQAGGPVDVTGRSAGGTYTLAVHDRGPGYDDATRARLFEPFFTTKQSGVGLGLAVCFGIVTAHGGTIRAERRSGGGASFVVELPTNGASRAEQARA